MRSLYQSVTFPDEKCVFSTTSRNPMKIQGFHLVSRNELSRNESSRNERSRNERSRNEPGVTSNQRGEAQRDTGPGPGPGGPGPAPDPGPPRGLQDGSNFLTPFSNLLSHTFSDFLTPFLLSHTFSDFLIPFSNLLFHTFSDFL